MWVNQGRIKQREMVHVWCECKGVVVKWLGHPTFDQTFEWEMYM